MERTNEETCEYLVIGSGLAGLTAALKLAAFGRVILASKKRLSDSNSDWAQGGIAAVVDRDDSLENHIRDTLEAGAGLCREEVVTSILGDGPDCIRDLEAWGVSFARREGRDGEYDLGREAGHSARRVLHSGDITGHEIIASLLQAVREHPAIDCRDGWLAVDLLVTDWLGAPMPNQCVGAYFLDTATRRVVPVRARATVLASGGAGKVYLYTTNPDTATGDGIAMAWRAGLPILNMEFVQFHPTCLYHPDVKSFLISEALRGEGGRLLNGAGRAFMSAYDDRGELAPRDIVARAIDDQMKKRGDTCVYLDITHRSREFLERRFPNISAVCRQYGIDIARDRIPVVPAAHYLCGGIEAGVDGQTALPGLYAIGEVACTGLHGANRLASNSLLEAVVMARRLSLHLADRTPEARPDVSLPAWQSGDAAPSDEAVVVEHNWNEIRTSMWDYVGIVRTNKRLERALRRVENLRSEIRHYYLSYEITPDVIELRNITAVAYLIVRCAQARRESRGLHYTLDYPEPGEAVETRLQDRPGGVP